MISMKTIAIMIMVAAGGVALGNTLPPTYGGEQKVISELIP